MNQLEVFTLTDVARQTGLPFATVALRFTPLWVAAKRGYLEKGRGAVISRFGDSDPSENWDKFVPAADLAKLKLGPWLPLIMQAIMAVDLDSEYVLITSNVAAKSIDARVMRTLPAGIG